MKHYIEITLIPNTDIHLFGLWSQVFQQIHLGLVEIKNAQRPVPIGISFPEYITGEKFSILGGKLRLFAQDEAVLVRFDAAKWLARLSDYVHCTSIRPVPSNVKGYATYQREQPKTNKERLARRYASRHNLDFETAFNELVTLKKDLPSSADYKKQFCYADMSTQLINSPFIRLQSLSSGHVFCLWIKKTVVSETVENRFSSYGLSTTSAVPEF